MSRDQGLDNMSGCLHIHVSNIINYGININGDFSYFSMSKFDITLSSHPNSGNLNLNIKKKFSIFSDIKKIPPPTPTLSCGPTLPQNHHSKTLE